MADPSFERGTGEILFAFIVCRAVADIPFGTENMFPFSVHNRNKDVLRNTYKKYLATLLCFVIL